jgi:RHS repeat-associated protein
LADLNAQELQGSFSQSFTSVAQDTQTLYEAPDPRQTSASTIANAFGFQGHARDPESGLVYMRNRYYDPEVGRFVTADPLGYVDGPSNHAFVGNDPANSSDPLGLEQPLTPTERKQLEALRRKEREEQRRAEELARRKEILQYLVSHCPPSSSAQEIRIAAIDYLATKRPSGVMPYPEAVDYIASLMGEGKCDEDDLGCRWGGGAGRLAYRTGNALYTAFQVEMTLLMTFAPLGEVSATRMLPLSDLAEAARGTILIPRGVAALDANALIRGLEGGELAAVDEALAGRTPTISITAAKEYLKKGDVTVLRDFLVQRGGRLGQAATAEQIEELQAQARLLGRVLRPKDAAVVGSAVREGAPLITRDVRVLRFLLKAGIPVETF